MAEEEVEKETAEFLLLFLHLNTHPQSIIWVLSQYPLGVGEYKVHVLLAKVLEVVNGGADSRERTGGTLMQLREEVKSCSEKEEKGRRGGARGARGGEGGGEGTGGAYMYM